MSESAATTADTYPPRDAPAVTDRPPQPWVLLVRILGVALAVIVLAVTTSALVSYYFQRTIEETRVLAGPVDTISGRVTHGSITVRVLDDAEAVSVHSKRRFSFDPEPLTTSLVQRRVTLASTCSHDRGSVFGTCSADLDVTVPPGVALDLTTAQGTLELEGPDAQTRLTTANGSVFVRAATTPRIDISTAAGGVTLEFATVPEDVVVRTAAGSVTIRVPADGTAYNVTGSTSLGSRHIDVPVDITSEHRIDVSSSVGSVTVTTR